MPEIKNTFTQGKMNQDLDERIVPNGQYIDAMNIKVSSSDDASVGVVQNILGNYRVEDVIPADSGYKCVATIADNKNNKLYWFVTQEPDPISAILQYDLNTEEKKFVLVDTNNSVLKFTQNIITGINIIDNLLFWTDNNSEPKKINIDNCIQGTEEANPTGITSLDSAISTRLIIDGVDKGDMLEEHITVIKKSPKYPPSISINEPTDQNTSKLFEKVFPRFSFRYRYKDGEYSSFGPFTQVIFNPKYIGEDISDENAYSIKESYNLAMLNNIESIEISNFVSSSIPKDVEQVEILYKEDGSPVVFSIKTINHDDAEWDANNFVLKSESISSAIPSNQLLRPWDNVPRKALAQEITGNRLVYGNYTQGYDLLKGQNKVNNKINADFGLREDGQTFTTGGKPSLKTQRNYQVGFVWGDKYGRETPVFTSEDGGVNIPWYNNDFQHLASKSLILKANLDTLIPTWADYYKLYVKETSGEYYNLIMHKAYAESTLNVYDQDEDRVWLSFPSTDRNKVTVDDYLILKKEISGNHEQVRIENKFKILDIQNEAPDAVKFEYRTLGKAVQTSSNYLTDSFMTNVDDVISKETDRVEIVIAEWLGTIGGGGFGVKEVGQYNVMNMFISWKNKETKLNSEKYRIISLEYVGTVYKLKLNRKITEADATLAQGSAAAGKLDNDLQISIERKDEKDLEEFSGKFFVQIVYNPPEKILPFDINGNNIISNQSKLNWLYDPAISSGAGSSSIGVPQDIDGVINVTPISAPPTQDSSEVTGGSGSTQEEGEWELLAAQLGDVSNNDNRGFFIDNIYMVAGQLFNDNVTSTLVRESGKTWIGWKEGSAKRFPTWAHFDDGSYGWSTLSASGGSFLQLPLTSSYSPRPFSFSGGSISKDPTKAMNGLEGFLTTKTEHVGDTSSPNINIGFRRWKGLSRIAGKPLQGLGDDTYGFLDDGTQQMFPLAKGDVDQVGRYFIHLSFLAPGEDLHDNDWELNPWLAGDENLKGVNSPGNHMQAIWGGGIFTNSTTNKILEMEGNYNELGAGLPGAPGPNVGYGYNNNPVHREKHDNQWNPAWPPSKDPDNKIQNFINNLRKDQYFVFSSAENEPFKIISDVKEKRIYNHTSWIAQYKWDGSATSPTVNNGGLVLCGNSVDEAAEDFLDDTSIQANFEALQDKITSFGRANNRRVVYIFEVDRNPLDVTGVVDNTTDFDSNSQLDIKFITTDAGVLLEDISQSPAIWETEAKPGENLDLYYEAGQAIPLKLTDETNELFAPIGCRVEILKEEARNGKHDITEPIYLESWDGREITLSGDGFNKFETDQSTEIIYADNSDPNASISTQIRFFREDGSYTTTRIVEEGDANGDYINTFTLDPTLDASMEHGLSYFNCYSFGNGIESNRIKDDFNSPNISKGVKASLTLDQEYKEENRKNGLIFSGIYNSTSGINDLNQFIMAEKITKDLNPTYGSIQKLFQRRISLIAFCEDRVVSITSNKNALYNADGNVQLVSTDAVLGDANPFVGDFGISKNPESFAKESYRAYFADKQRGAVLRLSMDGITPISDHGMDDYFRDTLKISGEIIGSYDVHNKNYNLTLKENTPGKNLIANDSLDTGSQSQLITAVGELVTDSEINNYTQLNVPDTTSGPFFASNIYENISINVDVTIQNWNEIPVGSLIPETFTITYTPATFTTFATTSSSIFYSHSINSSDNPFNSNNYGQDNCVAATSLSGGFDDNMDSHMYPVYHNGLLTPTTQRSQRDDFWSGVTGSGFTDHGPSGNIFWQYEADDYEDGSFTIEPSGVSTTYQNSSYGWQMNAPSADQPWFYAGTGVTAGYRGFIWDGMFEGGSTNQPTLALPGNRDADGTANDNLLLGQISTEYPNARNNTIFNGEEVKISFYFKHDPDLNESGTTTYSGPNGDTPRFVQITLYDGIPGSGGAILQSNKILDATNLPAGVTSSDYANYSQTPTTSTYELGYQTNRFVSFAEIGSTNNEYHVAYFKFTNGDELEGVCVDDLQVGFKVMNGDDGNGDRIYGFTYGNLGSVNIEKVFRLEECYTETSTSTPDGNAEPAVAIPAFATVEYSVSDWTVMNLANSSPLFSHTYIDDVGGDRAKFTYGYVFGMNLTTHTLTQSSSGSTATYQFPTTGTTSNNTVFYDDGSGGTGMYPNTSTFGGGTNTYGGTNQSWGKATIAPVNDMFVFENVVDGIRLRQDGLSLTTDDWYFIDIIYPLADAPDLGSGTGMIIKSGGSADGTPFNIVNTDIYYVYSGSNSNFANRDVLRAIFQIDSDQASNGRIDIAIPSDVKVHIDAIRLININDTYSGGEINDWTFNGPPNNPPSQHSFDRPKIYGGVDGIHFEVSDTDTTRIVDQWLFQKNNPIDTSLTPTPDGYEFKFTIKSYESGDLQVCIGNGATAIPLSNPHGGLCIGDDGTINQNGTYSVEFNFSDSMGGYDIKRDGVSTGDTTVANNYIIDKIVIKNRSDGFVGAIDNISLKDLTNYYTGATIGSFNISGFDQNLYTYIDFDVSNGQIQFNSAPRIGAGGDQVQIEQVINKDLYQNDTYRVRFEYDFTSNSGTGGIGFYCFSSKDNKGFKVEGLTGDGTYDELHTINEDHIADHLKDTFVFFVDSDDPLGTTGTIDNIMLRQEFIPVSDFPSTLSFDENVRGWVSKKSFIPEQGVSISSEYFTMKNGGLFEHNKEILDLEGNDTNRNTFYGIHEPSTIKAVLNESPSVVKSFNTLNYEGTQSKVKAGNPSVLHKGNYYNTLETYNQYDKTGWSVEYIKTDKQEGSLNEFIEKEGKWFNYIKGLTTDIKTSDLSFQGLGVVKSKQTI